MEANLATTPDKNKLKIKIPVVQSAEHEIEIDLPYYVSSLSGKFLKLDSEQNVTCVYNSSSAHVSISHYPSFGGFREFSNMRPITEQEFNEAFQSALTKIQNL